MNGATIIVPTRAKWAQAGVLEIASGSAYATTVRDARSLYPWSRRSETDETHHTMDAERGKLLIYHHTASSYTVPGTSARQLERLKGEAQGGKYGLPYNFVVERTTPHRIWYLNDVDSSWPHTYGYNWATAIAAWGNFETHHAPPKMVARMLRLADALAHMWQRYVEGWQHRDVLPTACPGQHLSPLLPKRGDPPF